MSNILVTGGAGFIGSHLCARLANLGHNVTSLDAYTTGSDKNHVPNVTYLNGWTQNLESRLFAVNEIEPPTTIFHLGEYSRVEQSFGEFDAVYDSNIVGTKNIVDFASEIGARLVYAGSSTKFANEHVGYVQSPYAWTKAKNTEFISKYSEWYGLDHAIVYFYNAYGLREMSTGGYCTLIGKYRELMSKGLPLPVTLPGYQRRNFTHVEDIVDGLIAVGLSGAQGDEYGIGHPDSYSPLEVAEMFGGEVVFTPEVTGNRLSAGVITEKTLALGWQPTRNLPSYILQLKANGWRPV